MIQNFLRTGGRGDGIIGTGPDQHGTGHFGQACALIHVLHFAQTEMACHIKPSDRAGMGFRHL